MSGRAWHGNYGAGADWREQGGAQYSARFASRPAIGSQWLANLPRASLYHKPVVAQPAQVGAGSPTMRQFRALLEAIANSGLNLGAQLAFHELSFSIPTKAANGEKTTRQLLHPVSGAFEAGSLVAIMGPSGSGKSTLLSILGGKKGAKYGGKVFVNGHERHPALFRRVTSFMPQFDFGSGLETVYESVRFVAVMRSDVLGKLQLPPVAGEQDPIKIILGVLGLAHITDSLIGNELVRGISGGQARRVALARAIVSFPSVLFLDECTSGLSSSDSSLVMDVLSELCAVLRTTVLATIHQPRESIFNKFDSLLLLAEGGQCVFNGPTQDAAQHFASLGFPLPAQVNPADFYMDVITESPDIFRRVYQNQLASQDISKMMAATRNVGRSEAQILQQFTTSPVVNNFRLSLWQQSRHVTGRVFRLMMRDASTLTVLTVHKIFMGIFIGLVYFDVASRVVDITFQITFLFSLLLAVAASAMQSIGELVGDRYTMLVERGEAMYSTLPYMISRIAKSIFISFFGNIILVVVSFFMAGFTGTDCLLLFGLAFTLFLAIDAIVSYIVAITSGVQTATSYSLLILAILGIFNGFTANTVASPDFINWISFVSPYFWAFGGAINVMFRNFDFDQTPQHPDFQSLLDSFGYPAGFEVKSMILNLAFTAWFRILQFFALKHTPAASSMF